MPRARRVPGGECSWCMGDLGVGRGHLESTAALAMSDISNESRHGVTAALLTAGRKQTGLLVAVPKGAQKRLLQLLLDKKGSSDAVTRCEVDLLSFIRGRIQKPPFNEDTARLAVAAGLPASNASACARAVRAELDATAAFSRAAPTDPAAVDAAVVTHAASVRSLHEKGLWAAEDRDHVLSRTLVRADADRASETHHVNAPPALDLTGYHPGYRWDFNEGAFPLFFTPADTTKATPLPTNEGRAEEFLCVLPLGPQCSLFRFANNADTLAGAIVHVEDGKRDVYVPSLLFVCDSHGLPVDGPSGGISAAMDGAAAVYAAAGATEDDRGHAAIVLL